MKDNKPPSSASDDSNAKSAVQDGLDPAKVNDLLENVNKRLAGGLHGSFFEHGSRLEETARHSQLETLFEVKSLLSDNLAMMQKQTHKSEGEGEIQSKAVSKGNTNLIATIKNVVQQQLADKLRDLVITNQRLEERLAKAEAANKALEMKVNNVPGKASSKAATAKKNVTEELAEKVRSLTMSSERWEDRLAKAEATTQTLEFRTDGLENCLGETYSYTDENGDEVVDTKASILERLKALEEWQEYEGTRHNYTSSWEGWPGEGTENANATFVDCDGWYMSV